MSIASSFFPGTFGSQKWNVATYSVVPDGTVAKMTTRACTAASNLPDYVGPDDSCANPTMTYQLSPDKGATWSAYDEAMGCDNATREPPCWLKVTLHYDFHLFAPLHVDLLGVQLGLPNTLTFERSSIYPMSDLELP